MKLLLLKHPTANYYQDKGQGTGKQSCRVAETAAASSSKGPQKSIRGTYLEEMDGGD